ncbi:MAG: YihA family ribosome biogenesis GTP-binding protein [Alphaproteobacteria bacterium]|nr:MAG: YihA family ribosome biogenesis GTP-binding protein [Alphaproteobacteria bacterium]
MANSVRSVPIPGSDAPGRLAGPQGPGHKLFASETRFVAGAESLAALPPPSLPEVAFVGRSNVGKSSLINSLTRRKSLARTSSTPGRTQQINFFSVAERLMLVDLPGYGFATAAKERVAAWQDLLQRYLKGRVTLRRVCLLVDSRHGIMPLDAEMMKLLDTAGISWQVVLTKVDLINATLRQAHQNAITARLSRHPAAFPSLMFTSSEAADGMVELRDMLASFALLPRE